MCQAGALTPPFSFPPGIPQVEIFTLQPLQLGQPNTLVCSVTNLFPPSADISWEHGGQLVTKGVSTPPIYPVQVLDFQVFSYLEVIPQEGDVYSCTVKTPRDKFSSMAYWGECPASLFAHSWSPPHTDPWYLIHLPSPQ